MKRNVGNLMRIVQKIENTYDSTLNAEIDDKKKIS